MRLTSWPKKGVNWSSFDKLSLIQARVKGMEDRAIRLVDVVQVMLVHLIHPYQQRSCDLWEYDPAEHQTLRELFSSSHKDIWKMLFKSGKPWPDSAMDRGYQLSHPASPVIRYYVSAIRMFYWYVPWEMFFNVLFHDYLRDGRRRRGGVIVRPRCRKNRLDHF